jgi:glucosamine 6-phosphate synthetase-like amidotransferase/phosphosugar isomerase protein
MFTFRLIEEFTMTVTTPDQPHMLVDILRQADVLSHLRDRFLEFSGIGAEHLAPGKDGSLYAFGCGDGWFAANAVGNIAKAAFGMSLTPATSLDFLLSNARQLSAVDRAVAISMSGTVDRTIAAAQRIRSAGGAYVALTNEDGAQMGAAANATASLRIDDIAPFLTGTTRYSGTILGLMMLVEGASRGTGHNPAFTCQGPEVSRLLESTLPETLDICGARLPAICQEVLAAGLGGIRVLGAGPDWATAEYGAAKLVKVVQSPVWGSEIEEFAHSLFWSSRQDELVVLLASTPEVTRLASNTASALSHAGMRTLAIESAGMPVEGATYRISLPETPQWLAPLLMPAPLQMLAYAMATASGYDPNKSQDQADPGRFLAAQLLSRRCELV